MKKYKLFLFVFTIPFHSVIVNNHSLLVNAQPITLTESDMPQIGTAAIERSFPYTTQAEGSAGPNQTWNFSSLSGGTIDTSYWISPASTPVENSFPNSNLAQYKNNSFGFYYLNNAVFEFLGYYYGGNTVINSPPYLILSLPITYLDSFSYSYIAGIQVNPGPSPYDSTIKKTYAFNNSLIDAWGTLIVPSGTYSSLRQKISSEARDSVFRCTGGNCTFYSSNALTSWTTYKWLGTDKNYWLFSVAINPQTSTMNYVEDVIAGTGNNEPAGRKTTPTITKEHISFISLPSEARWIECFNSLGKRISISEIRNQRLDLNKNDFNMGVYIYKIIDKNRQELAKGKFIIQ